MRHARRNSEDDFGSAEGIGLDEVCWCSKELHVPIASARAAPTKTIILEIQSAKLRTSLHALFPLLPALPPFQHIRLVCPSQLAHYSAHPLNQAPPEREHVQR